MIVRNPVDPDQLRSGFGASDFSFVSHILKPLLPLTAAVSVTVETLNVNIGGDHREPAIELQNHLGVL